MKHPSFPVITSFIAAVAVMLVGVFFFFEPIAKIDTSFISVHPAVGLLVYVGLSMLLFVWATNLSKSVYKGALLVVAPQAILILDLAMRGNRGIVTAIAGVVLLFFTWFVVGLIYSRLVKYVDKSQNT